MKRKDRLAKVYTIAVFIIFFASGLTGHLAKNPLDVIGSIIILGIFLILIK